MVRDPVCGASLDETIARDKTDYMGQRFHFCSPACREEFEREPERYVPNTRRDRRA